MKIYKKIIVGLLYGGQSFEHEVSKWTARSVEQNIDRKLFTLKHIYIHKSGNFDHKKLNDIDIAFLALHGPNCEDGKMQTYLQKRNIKYTGSGARASRINMNKIIQKKYFKCAGLQVVPHLAFARNQNLEKIKNNVINKLEHPLFIKPNNTGSSVGISKVESLFGLKKAIATAAKYDNNIIIEKAVVQPREFEVAILGNNKLIISEPGEIITCGEFYSYSTKYLKPAKATTTPQNLNQNQKEKLKRWAKKAYKITGCKGYARVDFFLDQRGNIYINEINTLPGFTSISMYPKLMEAAGIKYKDLITRIIKLALE